MVLASFLYTAVPNHPTLEDALSFILASKLDGATMGATTLRDVVDAALAADARIGAASSRPVFPDRGSVV